MGFNFSIILIVCQSKLLDQSDPSFNASDIVVDIDRYISEQQLDN